MSREDRRAARGSNSRDRKIDENVGKPNTYKKPIKVILNPKGENQGNFIGAIRTSEVSAAIGPAGVGKTYCAAGVVAQLFLENIIDGIILSRANVVVGESRGLLPGTEEEKMAPLLMPIIDALTRHLGNEKVDYMRAKKEIQLLSFEYMRGRSFYNKAVIIDEAQNLTVDDVITIVTRYESGRIILLGDPFQNDLDGECGLTWLEAFAERNNIKIDITVFGTNDIVRSNFVKKFIEALYRERGIAVD